VKCNFAYIGASGRRVLISYLTLSEGNTVIKSWYPHAVLNMLCHGILGRAVNIAHHPKNVDLHLIDYYQGGN